MRNYWKNIKLFRLRLKIFKKNALPVYDDRYIKTKIRTYGDKVYTNLRDINVSEDDKKCGKLLQSFLLTLLVYKNYYHLHVYLDNCAYKTVNKSQIVLMEIFVKITCYKCYITKKLI